MKYVLFMAVLLAVVGFVTLQNQKAEAAALSTNTPIVVELFTSQSCSSCPPADNLLGMLAGNPNIITLGCHVTYWDHLSWKDTLSTESCTKRQQAYAAGNKTNRIFTPEARINGKVSVVGSQRGQVMQAITQNAGNVAPITIERKAGAFTAQLPAVKTDAPLSLTLISYGKNLVQNIGSGENRGATINYHTPVNGIKQLPSWDGNTKTLTISTKDLPPNAAGFALLAQQNVYANTGPILAAGQIKLEP